ncbi:hypothetical protein D7X12_01720 [Corallococcus sicarius]|uniref:Uncharacterized protein n=2 Tax=Corallococcus sicarius TaxID=2316726 RepID=A0A3A8NZT1_9BACT|nr:hypothetical protein D7X12_01720 [Corallococcus sicarius]
MLCACLFGLSACDSTSKPTPDAGPVIPAGHPLVTPSDEFQRVSRSGEAEPFRFAFIAQAGRHYDLIVEAENARYTVELRDAAGGTLLDTGDRGADGPSSSFFTRHWSGLGANAVYTVRITLHQTSSQDRFTFRFVDKGLDDHADLRATATTPWVPSEQSLTGLSEHPGDRDVFSFQTVNNHVYALACTFVSTSWEMDFSRGDESLLTRLVNDGREPSLQGGLAFKSPGGMFHAYIQYLEDDVATPLPYSCVLRDLGAEDHGDSFNTAATLPLGMPSFQGKMEYLQDTDVFALVVQPQHHYRVTCTIDGQKNCDLRGALRGETFFNPGLDPAHLALKASGPTHYLRVSLGFLNVPLQWQPGNYTLQFEDLGEDDHGDTLATATSLKGPVQAVQVSVPDVLDTDFFSFQATAGYRYQFGCERKEVALLSFFVDSQGQELEASRADDGQRWVETFTAPKTATYGLGLTTGYPEATGDYACEFKALGP